MGAVRNGIFFSRADETSWTNSKNPEKTSADTRLPATCGRRLWGSCQQKRDPAGRFPYYVPAKSFGSIILCVQPDGIPSWRTSWKQLCISKVGVLPYIRAHKTRKQPCGKLNSRIRVYMNLKCMVPEKYFILLKVYFNTRKYHRSRVTERKGKSPLEIMTRKEYPEFLEILAY